MRAGVGELNATRREQRLAVIISNCKGLNLEQMAFLADVPSLGFAKFDMNTG